MIQHIFCIIICILLGNVESVEASMDFGDTLALILGLSVGTIAILACLGRHARRLGQGSEF